jgi:CBS domain containing-hemolysin-like protein
LLAARVLNALSNVVLVIAITFLVAERFQELWSRVLLSLLLSLGLVAIAAEVIPLALARRRAERVLKLMFPVFDAFARAIWPFTTVVKFILKIAMRIAGIREKENGEEEIEKGILEAVIEGEREGYIKREDRSMIASILDFRDEEVSSVMTPRTDMVSIPHTSNLGDAIAIAKDKGHSRIPVHKGNRDSIVGIVYVKDVLFVMANGDVRKKPVTGIMRKPFFVPETKRITGLLREFQNGKQHMAIVLDEYGGTAGLITVEDIIEEIVGEIADEYDTAEDDFYLKQVNGNTLVAQGVVRIDDINDELGIDIPEDQGFDTVAGFISHSMGRIPAKGEEYSFKGTTFTILEADERRISKVKITVSDEPEE